MAYLSLYRRHRPPTFAEMTGQEHITRTLSNALASGRLAHAYLFCGPRGTGKTTVAKILARAVNCEQYPAPEPCGICTACRNIGTGVSMDVIEMDAASNRGIDEIRELRERTRYASGENRYKVYIIDEAHMLTPEACNAFLKTLEEPPKNVIFILATTDPSRLPSTIVSRCQRFDFHLLTIDQIMQRLQNIMELEERQSEPEAVRLMARLADGSLRDAIGILEQCAAYSGEQITAEQVRVVTGATRPETIDALIKAAVDNDPDSGLEIIEQVVYSGRDLQLLVRDLVFVFSRMLLSGEKEPKAGQGSAHGFEKVVDRYRDAVARGLLLEAVELMHEVNSELRHAHFRHFILEVAFIRLLRLLHGRLQERPAARQEPVGSPAITDAAPAMNKEARTESLAAAGVEAANLNADPGPKAPGSKAPGGIEETGEPEPSPETDLFFKLKEDWPRIIQELKRTQKSTAAWLEPAVLEGLQGRNVRLCYPLEYNIHQDRIMENKHRKLVEEVLSDFCRIPISIKAVIGEGDDTAANQEPDHSGADASSASPETPYDPAAVQAGPGQAPADQAGSAKPSRAEEALELFGGKLIDPDQS